MRTLKKELWPSKIKIDVDNTNVKIDEIEIWLGITLGAFKTAWNAVYCRGYTDYYFRSEQDAVLFSLRWI